MKFHYTYQKRSLRIAAAFIDFFGYSLFSFRRRKTINSGGIKKILVVRPDQIGDNFLMTAFVQELKKIFKEAQIDIMAGAWAKDVWDTNPYINEFVIFNNSFLQLKGGKFNLREVIATIKKAKAKQYNLFIDSRGEPLTALIGFCARIPFRVGFVGHGTLSFLYTHTVEYIKEKNESLKYLDILRIFKNTVSLSSPKLYPTDAELKRVEELIISQFPRRKIIAVHLTSGAAYKIWPTENFAKLVTKIHKKHPSFNFAVLGGPNEERFYDLLQKNVSVPIHNLIGQLPLRGTYVFLSHCSLFIGNDSVLAHFAGSQNVPTVDLINIAIGGKERGRPPGEKVYLIEGNNALHKCLTGDCFPCPHMQAITVDEVFAVCDTILSEIQ